MSRVTRFLHPVFAGFSNLRQLAAREHYRQYFASAGTNFRFDPLNSSFSYSETHVGNNVWIGANARFNGPIVIGDDVMFGPDVHVRAGGHRFDVLGATIRNSGPGKRETITIGDDVWIAGRVTILRGVTVNEGTVVANGSIVTRDLPPYVVALGVPCRPIRRRFTDDELRQHLRLRGRERNAIEALIRHRNEAFGEQHE